MHSEDLAELWEIKLRKQSEAAVMPCLCGAIPAPVTNISGDERRRCCDCYRSEFRRAMDFGEN